MQKHTNTIALVGRLLLGAVFTVFGLNGFLHFMPTPAPSEAGGAFLGALAQTGYMFPLIKGSEVLAGLMLLSGFRAPLALVLLMPVTVNIVLYHLVLDPPGSVVPLILFALNLALAYYYRRNYAPLLQPNQLTKAESGAPSRAEAPSL